MDLRDLRCRHNSATEIGDEYYYYIGILKNKITKLRSLRIKKKQKYALLRK